jgi:NADPH2:quinone reductase
LGVAAQTAYLALVDRAELLKGETVLISGAAGSVGLATIEIAKTLGARVFAGIRGSGAAEHVRACGADEVIDLSMGDLRDKLRSTIYALTDGKGVDCMIDCVGGSVFDAGLRALAFRGRIVVVGFAGGEIASVKTNYLLLKTLAVVGFTFGDYWVRDPDRVRQVQTAINALIEGGRLRAHVAVELPLARINEAMAAVRKSGLRGRVIVTA